MQTAIYGLMASLLFGPNYQSIFLLSDAKKEIYYVVEQPTREKEVYDILKEFNDEQKAFDKGRKERTKGLRFLFVGRDATREELLPLFEDAMEEREILRNDYIKDRIKVQDLLTPEEWEQILSLSYGKFDKGRTGRDLDYARNQLLSFKPLIDIQKAIDKRIADPERRASCQMALEDYKVQLVNELDEIDDKMLIDIETLKRQNVSETEMLAIANRLANYRQEIFLATLQFRSTILENTTPEEWIKLAKTMVKLI